MSRKHTLESRITTDVYSYGTGDCVHFYNSIVLVLACHRFQVWHECLPAWMNRQVAFRLSLSLSGSKCLHRGCPAISPWASVSCLWFGSVSFTREEQAFTCISQNLTAEWSNSRVASHPVSRPLASKCSHLPQSCAPLLLKSSGRQFQKQPCACYLLL